MSNPSERSSLWRRGREAIEQRFADAATGDLRHFDSDVLPRDDVALHRGTAEQQQHEAAHGRHVLVLEPPVQCLADLIEPHRTAHAHATIGFFHDRRPAASFLDVADDLFEKILHRDETGRAAVLIHDDRHLRAIASHRGEDLVDRRRAGHVRQFTCIACAHGLIRNQVPQHVLDVNAADDVVEIAAVDRITCVRLCAHDRPQLVGLAADRYAGEEDARHHGFPGRAVAELEQVAENLSRLAAQQAAFLTLLNDVLKLLGRVVALTFFGSLPSDAECREQPVRQRVQRDDERRYDLFNGLDERREKEHRGLCAAERERFRDHLTDDEVEVGQECDRHDARRGVRGDPSRRAERFEHSDDPSRQPVFAVHSEAQARQRDADLRRRDVAILELRVLENPKYAHRQPAALTGLMLDVGSRRADDRELGSDEQPVGEDEQGDDEDRDQKLHHASASRGTVSIGTASTDSSTRSATRSTSNSWSPIATFSPLNGRWPSAAVTIPPTVAASVSNVVLSAAAASSTAMSPGRRVRPSARRSTIASPPLNSSPTSPSRSDSTSSSVSSPAVPPNSSTTSAWCDRRSRSSRTMRSAVTLSCTLGTGRTSFASVALWPFDTNHQTRSLVWRTPRMLSRLSR